MDCLELIGFLDKFEKEFGDLKELPGGSMKLGIERHPNIKVTEMKAQIKKYFDDFLMLIPFKEKS